MINLLPPEYASNIRYGRQNAKLARWLVVSILAIIGLLMILASGWVYINIQSNSLNKTIASTQTQLKAQNLSQVQKDAAEITGDIKVINQVLSNEIKFSDLTQEIGKDMPPGTVLNALSLTQIKGAIDLTANARDYTSAAQIAVNLSDPNNGLFSKVDIVNINCNVVTSGSYKCSGTYKALFSKTAQTKFLSVPGAKQ